MLKKIFGTKNQRLLKQYEKRVKAINALEEKYKKMSDDEIKKEFELRKEEVNEKLKEKKTDKETVNKVLEPHLNDVFAMVREAAERTLNMRHFDVQLIGGMVLHEGKIAEMKTGEGKTLVATLPAVLNAMTGHQVHIVTVNDYLAKRDASLMKPVYDFFGLKTGVVYSLENVSYEETVKIKKEAYESDIVYATNSEIGFDYLRDNLVKQKEDRVMKELFYAIIDEVDSILIDEARTPLIISEEADFEEGDYIKADEVAKQLKKGEDFKVDEKDRAILITEKGIKKAEELFGVENLYEPKNAILAHRLDNALKAHHLFEHGKDYLVKDDKVYIIDQFTGRISEGRRYGEGLHQALEAKERVEIQPETKTGAEISYQNLFLLYTKLAGMTGTAQTEATEFLNIYGLEVVSIPTNKPVIRKDMPDLIYLDTESRDKAVVEKIVELYEKGQPVLVGTTSVERTEKISKMLEEKGIIHNVLNAKNHEKEAEIIAKAGEKGAVTVATNMAGRGTDIKLGEGVKELGGLYIIGTERHESRRIDNQLRGRSGRQGDPGASQFYLSLDDNLLRIFGGEKLKNVVKRLGFKPGDVIESSSVSKNVEKAQKKIETMNFEARKHLKEYDDVIANQRKVIYDFRNQILDGKVDIKEKLKEAADFFILMETEDIFEPDDILNVIRNLKERFGVNKELVQNLEKIEKEILDIKNRKIEEYQSLDVDVYKTKIKEAVEKEINRITADEKCDMMAYVVYLDTLDEEWKNLLSVSDILRSGIGLRGYNQKDPLTEYKKEMFNLFEEMRVQIRYKVIDKILKECSKENIELIETFMQAMNGSEENPLENILGKHIDEILKNEDNEDFIPYINTQLLKEDGSEAVITFTAPKINQRVPARLVEIKFENPFEKE